MSFIRRVLQKEYSAQNLVANCINSAQPCSTLGSHRIQSCYFCRFWFDFDFARGQNLYKVAVYGVETALEKPT